MTAFSSKGLPRLEAHARDCAECAATPLPLADLAAHLESEAIPIDTISLSARVMTVAGRELRERGSAAFRERVASAVLWSLVPLLVVGIYDVAVVSALHRLLSSVLPSSVATYFVVSWSAFWILLFASTYAAIPILLARQQQRPSSPMAA